MGGVNEGQGARLNALPSFSHAGHTLRECLRPRETILRKELGVAIGMINGKLPEDERIM